MNNLVNRRMFKGKYFKDIEKGILNEYSKIYPKDKLHVSYKSNDCYYYFAPCLLTPVIDCSGKVFDSYVTLYEYDNLTSIKLFATNLTEDDFAREYDDYSLDYIKKLEEDINDYVKQYIDKGFVVKVDVDNRGYGVSWYHPDYSKEEKCDFPNYRTNRFGYCQAFGIVPISKATYKSGLSKIKRSFKDGIERLNKDEGASLTYIK